MSKAEKVLWGEGLFLRPQHFQLQDRYHEQRLTQSLHACVPFAYGIQQLKVDQSQLALHVLALEQIEMIWQDGELYRAPSQDLLPEPIQLDQLNIGAEMWVYLALPSLQANKQNVAHTATAQAGRYHSFLQETHDLFTDAAAAEITLLRRRAVLKLLDSHIEAPQDLDGFHYIAIAKIKRQHAGHFELDPRFIAPILHIQASDHLMNNLKHILNVIQAKIKTIQSNNRENEQKIIEFRSGDIVSFWLVNALNTAYASLNHLYQHAQIHPERLFFELLRLSGSLLTFSTAYQVEHLPKYQHLNLQESFSHLDRILRELLDTIISNRYISIGLTETRPSYWVGQLASDKINRDARLYLALSSRSMQTHELIQIVPLRVKVGNSVDVEQRVVSALPAIPLHHMMQVPTAIPVRSGVSYFEIEPHHELYQRMLDAQSICIYVPAGFQDISLELIAVVNAE